MEAVAKEHGGNGGLRGDAKGEAFSLCVEACHLWRDSFFSALRRVRLDDAIEYIHRNLLR